MVAVIRNKKGIVLRLLTFIVSSLAYAVFRQVTTQIGEGMDDSRRDTKRINLGEDWFDVITQLTLSYRRNKLVELPSLKNEEKKYSTASHSVIQKNEVAKGKVVKDRLACL